MSPELALFYREIQAWIDEGCPPHPKFVRTHGLCGNLCYWLDSPLVPFLMDELETQFHKAGLNVLLPFNRRFDNSSAPSYEDEAESGTIFQNPKRLEWIRKHSHS